MLVKKQKINQKINKAIIIGVMACTSVMPVTVYALDNVNIRDPFEETNRKIYKFNRALDKGFIRTIAYGYYSYTPKELQAGIHNFFENLGQPITIANDILQSKLGYAVHDTSRFIINSTFGLVGFFEVAAVFGLEPRKEDFGQTLHCWGYKKSIYLMLPIFGPSTLRDTIGFVVDSLYFDPITYLRPVALQYGLAAGRRLDLRVMLLPGEKLLENIGVDEYAFIRDFYFQKRNLSFYDGQLPENDTQGDPFAEPGFDTESEFIPTTEKKNPPQSGIPPDPFAEPGFDVESQKKDLLKIES